MCRYRRCSKVINRVNNVDVSLHIGYLSAQSKARIRKLGFATVSSDKISSSWFQDNPSVDDSYVPDIDS